MQDMQFELIKESGSQFLWDQRPLTPRHYRDFCSYYRAMDLLSPV